MICTFHFPTVITCALLHLPFIHRAPIHSVYASPFLPSRSSFVSDARAAHGYAPPTIDFKKRRNLRLKETPYHFVDIVLFRKNYDGCFLSCLEKLEADKLLVGMHVGPACGHFS